MMHPPPQPLRVRPSVSPHAQLSRPLGAQLAVVVEFCQLIQWVNDRQKSQQPEGDESGRVRTVISPSFKAL